MKLSALNFLFIFSVLTLLGSCKKNIDDNENKNRLPKICYPNKIYENEKLSTTLEYDADNHVKKISFFYDSPSINTINFSYNGTGQAKKIEYFTDNQRTTYIDVFYDRFDTSSSIIEKMIAYEFDGSDFLRSQQLEYKYNGNKQVSKITKYRAVGEKEWQETGYINFDYADNNVREESYFEKDSTLNYINTQNILYEYDDKRNPLFFTFGKFFLFERGSDFSMNNVTKIKVIEGNQIISVQDRNYQYSGEGFPNSVSYNIDGNNWTDRFDYYCE